MLAPWIIEKILEQEKANKQKPLQLPIYKETNIPKEDVPQKSSVIVIDI